MEATVERRLLVNYRVDPHVIAPLLPEPLRPQLVDGWAVAGICLIRLGQLRPRGFPRRLGLSSENAAHRIAVEWDGGGGVRTGVFIPRRDSNSIATVMLGGRVFPGAHHFARFTTGEANGTLSVAFASRDESARAAVMVEPVADLPESALFSSTESASRFFERGSSGYSTARRPDQLDGLMLTTKKWHVEAARVVSARSSFFEDERLFPRGSATLDCALLMREVPVEWHTLASLSIVPSRLGLSRV